MPEGETREDGVSDTPPNAQYYEDIAKNILTYADVVELIRTFGRLREHAEYRLKTTRQGDMDFGAMTPKDAYEAVWEEVLHILAKPSHPSGDLKVDAQTTPAATLREAIRKEFPHLHLTTRTEYRLQYRGITGLPIPGLWHDSVPQPPQDNLQDPEIRAAWINFYSTNKIDARFLQRTVTETPWIEEPL